MSNAYHILAFQPALQADAIAPDLEALARQVVASGRLRINADTSRNFVKYSGAGFDKSFSKRELTTPQFLDHVRRVIADTLPGYAGAAGVEEVVQRLLQELKRAGDVPLERELQVARVLVQAVHPAVMQLLLLERVDIFVSYSHNVADLMGIHFWETIGHSGGLQSVSGDGTAVYVSCGGDPFIAEDKHKTYVTDGFPALARMIVIAAQEFGHYADLIRNSRGQHAGRHSASLAPLRAHADMRKARLDDMETVRRWYQACQTLGLGKLLNAEKSLAFYKQNRKGSPMLLWQWMRVRRLKRALLHDARIYGHVLVERLPVRLLTEKPQGFGHQLAECLRDMAFNLAPDADAYRRPDPREEEAIAVIEALARVPQQVCKWGHAATELAWPNLYLRYYQRVIPANIAAYEAASGKRYQMLDDQPVSGLKNNKKS